MIQVNDEEYLKRQLIPGVKYEINAGLVRVASENTLWAHNACIEPITKESLLNIYRMVYKSAKNQGIAIAYKRHIKRYIENNWEEYIREVVYYKSVFSTLVEQFKQVQNRGIHMGSTDDIILNKALHIRNEYEKVYYRTSVVSQIMEVKTDLQRLSSSLSTATTIYL